MNIYGGLYGILFCYFKTLNPNIVVFHSPFCSLLPLKCGYLTTFQQAPKTIIGTETGPLTYSWSFFSELFGESTRGSLLCIYVFSYSKQINLLTSGRSQTRRITSIPAEVSQNVTNKDCLVCVKSKKYASWVTLRPLWDRYRRGEAEVRILDFKTKWSESQKVSQTANEQGKAEQCIFDFKTTWSEFQKPSQTATEQGEAKLRIFDFKTT